ncbi:MAG: hypothetical protein POELPBGB_03989 [Bacteroidia bacterium]|nr:hypothetical protein [Bacteroidia bacterium]
MTTAEAKTHCRVDISDDDALIDRLITAARRRVEHDSLHALLTQTWELVLGGFPDADRIELPYPPLQSITSVTYVDSAGASTTWSSSNYHADTDSTPGRLVAAYGVSWPTFTPRPYSAVRVRYVAGWTAADSVPAELRQAVLLLVGHWYEQREAVLVGNAGVGAVPLPLAYDALIADYRHRARRF